MLGFANRKFFVELSDALLAEGFFLGNGDDYDINSYRIDYSDTQKKDSYIVRFYAGGMGKLEMRVKFYNSGCYDKYLDTLPAHINQIFSRQPTCDGCNKKGGEGCSFNRPRIFEGKVIMDCAQQHLYKYSWFGIKAFQPGDAKYYLQLLLYEREAIKLNATKKGIKVYKE